MTGIINLARRRLLAAVPAAGAASLVSATATGVETAPAGAAQLSEADLARFHAWVEFERHFQVTGVYEGKHPYGTLAFVPAHEEARRAVAIGPYMPGQLAHIWVLKPISTAFDSAHHGAAFHEGGAS